VADLTPAGELRAAADLLRERADIYPGVALPLAALLDAAAKRAEDNPFGAKELIVAALVVARAVLGSKEDDRG
jgi:hypothetical protein